MERKEARRPMNGPDTPSMDEITASPDGPPDSIPSRSRAVRCLLFGVSTDDGPRLLAFRASNLLIGRLPDNHLAINHVSVSRRHARISVGPRGVTLEDIGSQNGTTVNGTPVPKGQPLRPGDIIRLGHVPLFYFGFIDPDDPPQPLLIEHSLSITPSPTSL